MLTGEWGAVEVKPWISNPDGIANVKLKVFKPGSFNLNASNITNDRFKRVRGSLPITVPAAPIQIVEFIDPPIQAYEGTRVKFLEKVIKYDRHQPEFFEDTKTYITKRATKARVLKATKLLKTNQKLFDRIEKEYNVEKELLLALWGIETNFGKHTGSFSVISALTTLAFDGRRSAFFRKELINALKILNAGHVELAKMKGSWAGAMGQCQFMPSTFMQYAIDYNGDGKKDLWGSKEDALASAANYLTKMGWDSRLNWGREVLAPNNFSIEKNMVIEQTLKEWSSVGFKNLDKTSIPSSEIKVKLLALDSEKGGCLLYTSDAADE